ncbi:MAG: mechanosensitive ion channel family protein, partial [Gemmatimonadaceae bacterium]
MVISDLLNRTFYGNTVSTWLNALVVLVVSVTLLELVRALAIRRLGGFARRTTTSIDDMIVRVLQRTRVFLLIWLSLTVALRALVLPPGVASWLGAVAFFGLLAQVGVWLSGATAFWADHYSRERASTDAATVMTMRAASIGARVLLWSLLVLFALEHLNYSVTSLVTGLGIGGIALALAVQNVLGDVLAALSIVIDKPFVVGDAISVDTFTGTVEHVGLKTTRIRSATGEQIIFSNADLLRSRIRNFKRMYERNVTFAIGVVYGTPYATVARIPGIIREAIEGQPHTRFDRSHFRRYTDSALEFETVYAVLSTDYITFVDTQQA